jgi:hypothetical protein
MAATIGGMKDRYGLLATWLLLILPAVIIVQPVLGQPAARASSA